MLRTPVDPRQSFDDDPLRMMRAARFAAQLGFAVDPAALAAIVDMADRIAIVSAERVRDELSKLLVSAQPRAGPARCWSTRGLAEHVLPELPALRLEIDEHHRHKDVYEHSLTVLDKAIALETGPDGAVPGPDLVLRLAALLHDIGKPATRRFEDGGGVSFHHHEMVGAKLVAKRLKELRFDKATVQAVARLTELHLRFHGYGEGELDRLGRAPLRHRRRPAARAAAPADPVGLHHAQPAQGGPAVGGVRRPRGADRAAARAGGARLDPPRPRRHADHGDPRASRPGREVGEAYKYLLELRMERGPLGPDVARDELLAWWAARA